MANGAKTLRDGVAGIVVVFALKEEKTEQNCSKIFLYFRAELHYHPVVFAVPQGGIFFKERVSIR